MANEKIDLRKELKQLRYENLFIQKVDCSREDNKAYKKLLKEKEPLPPGILQYRNEQSGEYLGEFYKIHETDLTFDEKRELLALRHISYIKTIKNGVMFFVALAAISLVSAIILLARYL